MNRQIKGTLMLTLAALIWGTAFVAQYIGMDYTEPFTFMAARNYVGFVSLLPLVIVAKKNIKKSNLPSNTGSRKLLIISGILCGIVLFTAGAFQQIGIGLTSVGKAGFLTTLYIIIVPLLGLPFGKKLTPAITISGFIALCGTYLLSVQSSFTISWGDTLIIACAFFFSIHIIVIDYFSPKVNSIFLSCLQFFVSATLSLICALIFETPRIHMIVQSAMPILYTGIMSSAVAFTLQIVGQRSTPPAASSVIMSLEAVFAAISGWLILRQTLSIREISGCALVFIAVLLIQLIPEKKSAKINQ